MKKILYLIICFSILLKACSKDDDIAAPIIPPTVDIDISVDSTQTFNEILSGQSEADRLCLWFKYSDFGPTGVYVKASIT